MVLAGSMDEAAEGVESIRQLGADATKSVVKAATPTRQVQVLSVPETAPACLTSHRSKAPPKRQHESFQFPQSPQGLASALVCIHMADGQGAAVSRSSHSSMRHTINKGVDCTGIRGQRRLRRLKRVQRRAECDKEPRSRHQGRLFSPHHVHHVSTAHTVTCCRVLASTCGMAAVTGCRVT